MANDESEDTSPPRQKMIRWGAGALLLILLLVVLFSFLRGGDRAPDVWSDTTVPFDSACTENCSSAGTLGTGAHGAPGVELWVNPAVDDPIAQWGDCLQSIFVCLAETGDPSASMNQKAETARTCVSASACPAPCLERYARRAAGSPEAAEQAFDEVFIGENAWCLPEEGRL